MGQVNAQLRRATRYYFGGVVEITDLESGRTNVAMIRALNAYGCFVKTEQSFRVGAALRLTMTHAGREFSANGRVVNQNEIGIGVEFTAIEPKEGSIWKSLSRNWRRRRRRRTSRS